MKRLLLIPFICMVCACSSITYQHGDDRVTYSRIGTQNIAGLEIVRTKEGARVKIESLSNTSGDMWKTMANLSDLAVKAGK